MLVLLLKPVTFVVVTLWSLLTRLIFNTIACTIVLLLQGLKGSGEGSLGIFQQVAEGIRGCFEFILRLIINSISSTISKVFDILQESITGSVTASGTVAAELAEKLKTSIEESLKQRSSSRPTVEQQSESDGSEVFCLPIVDFGTGAFRVPLKADWAVDFHKGALLVQIWAIEHLSLRPTGNRISFPRFLQWPKIDGNSKILKAFAHHRQYEKRISALEDEVKVLKATVALQDTKEGHDIDRYGKNREGSSEVPIHSPVSTFPSTNVDRKQCLDKLYAFCTSKTECDLDEYIVLVSVDDQILIRCDLQSMKVKAWVDNMDHVLRDLKQFRGGRQKKWMKTTISYFAPNKHVPIEDIKHCGLVEIGDFRRTYVCQWVLHPRNIYRNNVLKEAGLPLDLKYE
ncbi:hypothetical protein E2542_SST09051 [Spatholobus suberectus]|nr:hypothetical protein E2542_SST09051 [Spatholobus suberectus]